MLLALLGATTGQGVIWYTGRFHAPFFVVFGALPDRIGGLHIILAGGGARRAHLLMLFGWLAQAVYSGLYECQQKADIHVTVDPANCHFKLFVQWPGTPTEDCETAKGVLARAVCPSPQKMSRGLRRRWRSATSPSKAAPSAPWTSALIASGYPNFKATGSTVALTAHDMTKLQAAEEPVDKLPVLNDARKATDTAAKPLAAFSTIDSVTPQAPPAATRR